MAKQRTAKRSDQAMFIKDYIQLNQAVCVTDTDFHDAFWRSFGGKRKYTYFGAQPVHKAMKLLSDMAKHGELRRYRLSVGEAGSGYPNWVYVYDLS